jgi:hypothetical protein
MTEQTALCSQVRGSLSVDSLVVFIFLTHPCSTGETANGPYFEEAVKVMSKTCVQAEASRNYNALFQTVRNSVLAEHGHLASGESLASSAVKTR